MGAPVLEQLSSVLTQKCALAPPAQIVVGVSGGADSLCLLHALHSLGFQTVAAHVDHQLRPSSAEDAQAVETIAASLGIPFVAKRVDVAARADAEQLSLEDAGRRSRYEFLLDEARRRTAAAVAVGHTADDQVETVLMHLIRGTGMAGLKGMAYRSLIPQFDARIPIVRPLLGTWRSETVAYCRAQGMIPRQDESNASVEFLRNRIRHELIPLLETYNPRVREALWRTACAVASDLSIMEAHVSDAWTQALRGSADQRLEFDSNVLVGMPEALRRRVIMRAVKELSPESDIGFLTLEGVARFVVSAGSATMELGNGLILGREPAIVWVAVDSVRPSVGDYPQLEDATVMIPDASDVCIDLVNGWQFQAHYEPVSAPPLELISTDPYKACLDAQSLPSRLELRKPRPGDRIEPLGLHGHSQKLSDVFVNQKVPLRARERWPLLCGEGEVVWMPGYRPAEKHRITDRTQRVACFSVTRGLTDSR